jgi:hypothetical protein
MVVNAAQGSDEYNVVGKRRENTNGMSVAR